jgi:CBS domain-containing protein
VICPVCHWQNFIGEDVCENCGADLTSADTPQAATTFHGNLLGRHLDELGAPRPKTTERDTTVGEVIRRMQAESLDCVLVTDDGRLVGIFTDRDAVLKVAGGKADMRTKVGDLMTADPVVLRRDDPIAVAINKMAVGGFRHVPILDRGHPVSVVSARDVFRHIAQRLG